MQQGQDNTEYPIQPDNEHGDDRIQGLPGARPAGQDRPPDPAALWQARNSSGEGGSPRNGAWSSPRPGRVSPPMAGSPMKVPPREGMSPTPGYGSPRKHRKVPSDAASVSSTAHRNFKVVIRVRPPLPRELNGFRPFHNIVGVDREEHVITVSENLQAVLDEEGNVTMVTGPFSTHVFTFDHVYDQGASQRKVYENTASEVVESSLQGYNATIFAYGQTGTGKTYTMEGFPRGGSYEERGIIPRAIEQVFGHIRAHASSCFKYLVRASYLQIYNEQISDLLDPSRSNLAIRESQEKGVYVAKLSEWVVRSPEEIYGLMERGGQLRATGATKLNEISSRSHAVFIIILEQSESYYVDDNNREISRHQFERLMHRKGLARHQIKREANNYIREHFKIGKLNLVDLAGSERVRLSGATGQRLEESKRINQSLSALGNVISALTDPKGRQHIPYRDSKLTRILEDSLGGNCKTTMMAMISPALESMVETLSTVKFANRAKNIKNEARVNEDLDQKSLLRKYERELKRLRAELEERNKNVVDKRQLLQLEEERRRAEADKMLAIRELEARSEEIVREKEEKKRLEMRIKMLQSQMIVHQAGSSTPSGVGSTLGSVPGTPLPVSFSEDGLTDPDSLLSEKLRPDPDGRPPDGRPPDGRPPAGKPQGKASEEEKDQQLDRFKQLLLHQKAVMLNLTHRLQERDVTIKRQQADLESMDQSWTMREEEHKAEVEDLADCIDRKTGELLHLQKFIMACKEMNVLYFELHDSDGNLINPPQELLPEGDHGPARIDDTGEPVTVAAGSLERVRSLIASHGAARNGNSLARSPSPMSKSPLARASPVRVQSPESAPEAGAEDQPWQAAEGGGDVSNAPGGQFEQEDGRLLEAHQKISELSQAVGVSREKIIRMSQELEEVRTEKVNVEYSLRTKVERLVQQEIEGRLSLMPRGPGGGAGGAGAPGGGPGGAAEAEALRRRIRELTQEVMDGRRAAQASAQEADGLRQRLAAQEAASQPAQRPPPAPPNMAIPPLRALLGAPATPLDTDDQASEASTVPLNWTGRPSNESLEEALKRCRILAEERKAIRLILERKIRVLVESVAGATGALLQGAAGQAGAPEGSNSLSHDVASLRRLVNASITALQGAEDSDRDRVGAGLNLSEGPPTPAPTEREA